MPPDRRIYRAWASTCRPAFKKGIFGKRSSATRGASQLARPTLQAPYHATDAARSDLPQRGWMVRHNSRLHSTLDYLNPMQRKQRWLAPQRKKAHVNPG